jgi:hypothetical protein
MNKTAKAFFFGVNNTAHLPAPPLRAMDCRLVGKSHSAKRLSSGREWSYSFPCACMIEQRNYFFLKPG